MKNLFLITLITLFTSCSNDVGRYEIVYEFDYALEIVKKKNDMDFFYFQEAQKNLGDLDTIGRIVVLFDTKNGDFKYKNYNH